MRIRKHLSSVHLPAASAPRFKRVSCSAAAADDVSPLEQAAAASTTTQIGNLPHKDDNSAAVTTVGSRGIVNSHQDASASVLMITSSSLTGSVVQGIHSSPSARMNSIAEDDLKLVVAAAAPRTPLPTRPKRTKPNPILKSCSNIFYQPPPPPQQLHHDCMSKQPQLQDRIDEQDEQEELSSQAVEVGEQATDPSDSSAERNLEELQLTEGIENASVEQKSKVVRRPQRTAAMKIADTLEDSEVDGSNQCRRRDGKGWRCHRKTQSDYSLCEYHLDKFRETNQRKRQKSRARRKPVKARSLRSI